MALNGLFCADVPFRNYSLTHSRHFPVLHFQTPLTGVRGNAAQLWKLSSFGGIGKVRARGRLSSGWSGAEGERGTNVAWRRASGGGLHCLRSSTRNASLVSQTVDSRKINLSHNFGQGGPPAVLQDRRVYRDRTALLMLSLASLVTARSRLYTPAFMDCQRARPEMVFNVRLWTKCKRSQTIAPADSTDLFSLGILSTIPWLLYSAAEHRRYIRRSQVAAWIIRIHRLARETNPVLYIFNFIHQT